MTGLQSGIFAISLLLLTYQVGCEERTGGVASPEETSDVENTFVPIPVKFRVRRSTGLDSDDCHVFNNHDLPKAKENVKLAWTKSLTAVQNITQAVTDLKECLSWNIFSTVPCIIHSSIELYYSYKTYKPELTQFLQDIRTSSKNATTTFFGCAKILLLHQG